MSLDDLKVSLAPHVRFFWKYFDTHFDHEMRIEKASTPVFPYLFYQVSGLDPNTAYSMALHFELASKQQFQYEDGKWRPSGTAEKHGSLKQVLHEWGVMRGREWMEKGFSFRSVRISRDFGTTSESVIPLNVRHKYRPVLSIRELPTPRKPCPAVIQCRLDHTEFIAVSRFENEHVRSLKLMNRNGQADREELWAKSVAEPPVFATCTLVNAHNASIPKLITPTLSSVATSIPRLLGLQDVIFTISKHQGEGDATQKKNITENASTSSGSAHPLSVEKLYLSMDKKKATTRGAEITLESILRNCPPNVLKQLMDMQAAMNFKVHIPTASLTPGITPPRVEQPEAKQVVPVEVSKNDQEGIAPVPTAPIPPAVEPLRKKLRVEIQRGDRDTKGKRKVVCPPPTLAQDTFKNGSDVSKTPSTSESVSIHPLSVSNVEFFCRNCPPDLLEKMKAMTPQEAMYIDIGQFFEAYFTQGITPPGMEQQEAEQVVPVEVPKNGQVSIAPVPTAPILPAVEPPRKKLRVELERKEGDTDEEEENVRLGHVNLFQPPVVPDGSLAQSMPKFRLPANQSDFPPQMFNSRFQRTPYSFPVTLPYFSSMAGLPRTFSANSMLQPSVVRPQYTFRVMPIQNIHPMTQPLRFDPSSHLNPTYPPMTQTLFHNNINSKKRPFYNDM